MKRNDFFKSILGISLIGGSTKLFAKDNTVKLDGTGSISTLSQSGRTITINGCTQYLNSNPTFVVRDNMCSITDSSEGISIEIKKMPTNFNVDYLYGQHESFILRKS